MNRSLAFWFSAKQVFGYTESQFEIGYDREEAARGKGRLCTHFARIIDRFCCPFSLRLSELVSFSPVLYSCSTLELNRDSLLSIHLLANAIRHHSIPMYLFRSVYELCGIL
jgi:hypothetical protein